MQEWKTQTPYCIRCRWLPPRLRAALEHTRLRAGLPPRGKGPTLLSGVTEAETEEERQFAAKSADEIQSLLEQKTVKIGLQLYKVRVRQCVAG